MCCLVVRLLLLFGVVRGLLLFDVRGCVLFVVCWLLCAGCLEFVVCSLLAFVK